MDPETELEQAGELVTHAYSAYQLALLQQQRMEQRNQARLRQARKRLNAPTTHESATTRERRSA